MNHPAAPRLKSLPAAHRPTAAEPPASPAAGGDPKGVGRRPSTSRPDPRRGDGRYPVAWLHITAPGRGAVPVAMSVCACGRNRSAVGRRKVLALIEDHAAHRDLCPLRHRTESRTAA